jgi:flavin reductase (DIM6/NTAB) family NADH-FMN oxidoreductase RutF
MNQSELMTAFESGTIESADFPHAHHVHVAWGLAQKYGAQEGLQRLVSGIRQIATRAGRPEAFHLTITKAWFELIATVDDLHSAPELLNQTILSRYYSPARLAEGRDRWLEPDLHPLTLPLPPAIEQPTDLKELFGSVPTPVGVLTTHSGQAVHATTVSSITSISLQPPLISVCLANNSRALELVRTADTFVVSVLASDQKDLADKFASRTRPPGAAQFAGIPHHASDFGPVIERAVASLGCRLHAAHPCGDHHIVIGEVASVERSLSKHALLRHADTYIPNQADVATL